MLSNRTIICIAFAVGMFLASSVNCFCQIGTGAENLSALSSSRMKLPRYNFWVDGSLGPGLRYVTVKRELISNISLSHNFYARAGFSADYRLSPNESINSVYFGLSAGLMQDWYEDYDRLSSKEAGFRAGYLYIDPFIASYITGAGGITVYLKTSYSIDSLLGADIDNDSRLLAGIGTDCLTRYLSSACFDYGFLLGRVQTGVRLGWTFDPFLSAGAIEYYTGAPCTVKQDNFYIQMTVSFLLGGTDR